MRKVLCLCQGNTCRSPMMERMLRRELEKLGVSDIHVESAGLMASAAGQPMAEYSMNELDRRGIDSSGHVSRYVGSLELSDFDAVLTVGETEVAGIREHADCPDMVIVLNGNAGGVPNPWQQGEVAYSICANLIEKKVREFAKTL